MKNCWKYLKMEIWCYGFQKDPKIKEGNFLFPWIGSFWMKKDFNNNNVQLNTLSNEDVALVNVNKLKAYQNPIIIAIVIIVIIENINGILLKAFVKGWTFGGRWKQLGNLYEHLNPNGRKRRKQHNKNYGNKIFMTVPKKLIRIINNKKVPWPFIMMQK